MSMDMADDAAHVAKGCWRILDPALGVYGQAIGLATLTHPQFATVSQIETGVAAVVEVLGQAEDGDLVLIGLALPGAELGAVAALVAVGIQVQGLELILEARYGDGDV